MKAIRTKDKIWIQKDGRIYSMPAEISKGRASNTAAQELVAPFSCKVLKIHASAGQALKAGDPVVVVEAMKMEYSYASPREGMIAEILVKEGQIVQAGAQFVRWKDKA